MENNTVTLCTVCHQILKPEYYFCPNCGTKVQDSPLSTDLSEQAKLYIYSFALPWIGFFTIGKWKGIKYLKSKDEKNKKIGTIACLLMAVSFIILCYVGYIEYQAAVKSINDSITSDFGI
jgi:surface polysaccharide O-acyltransferase-like enzyme